MKREKSINDLKIERPLLKELDSAIDANAERLWTEEAQRRYDAYLKGELEALSGEEVMNRARNALSGAVARP